MAGRYLVVIGIVYGIACMGMERVSSSFLCRYKNSEVDKQVRVIYNQTATFYHTHRKKILAAFIGGGVLNGLFLLKYIQLQRILVQCLEGNKVKWKEFSLDTQLAFMQLAFLMSCEKEHLISAASAKKILTEDAQAGGKVLDALCSFGQEVVGALYKEAALRGLLDESL